MGIIKELSSLLTNQIAAGEVIERPASVVKELLENSVDAGSTRIEISLLEAGLRSIYISDNGQGMSPEDARLAIKRHTTSKLYSPEQLFRIRTLGFRGEALASITAVSKVTLKTSTGEGQGIELYLEGGQIIKDTPIGLPKGTSILVEDLFYNTPARLKYLKSIQTELAHITDVASKMSLSHPQIAFILKHDNNFLLRTSGNDDLRQAIAGNLGTDNARKMVAFEGEDLDFHIQGYTSIPELTRSNRNNMSIFINGRSIKNFAINRAIIDAYGSTLMIGRFPISVIKVTMDSLLVDVNVHPTKQEVRISKEKELVDLIKRTISVAIKGVQRIPGLNTNDSFKGFAKKSKVDAEQEVLHLSQESISDRSFPGDELSDFLSQMNVNEDVSQVSNSQVSHPAQTEGFENKLVEEEAKEYHLDQKESIISSEEELVDFHQENSDYLKLAKTDMEQLDYTNNPFPELYYFGQMHGTYLFAQNQDGLYMIDQHAAQERIKYEYFKVEIGNVAPHFQQLLVPLVLTYSKQEVLQLQERSEALESMGIHLEPFGSNSFQLQEHPAWIKKGQEIVTIEAIIDFVLKDKSIDVATLREATAIMMSCKQSIKANHHLSDIEARQLLLDLSKCSNPYNCPHGRPVLVHFSNKDMEHLFKRIQDPHRSRSQEM